MCVCLFWCSHISSSRALHIPHFVHIRFLIGPLPESKNHDGMNFIMHGLPKNIISDRDVLFTSVFWGHLHKLIGTKLKMSSAYHPETDGSTEQANQTVTQMVRQCINNKQTDWISKLPAIEFAINSARSESTGFAPFFFNTRWMPRSLI